jgi:glycosyltransferase involved in cell wall biosynthesis
MSKIVKVVYLSDYPFSLSYGGKEIQLLQYYNKIKELDGDKFEIKLLNYWDIESLKEVDIIHFFGYSNWFNDLMTTVKSKYKNIKIVVSPTYYISNIFRFKILSKIFRKFPIPNYFSYKNSLFSSSDTIICNSNSEVKQMTQLFPAIDKRKFVVLHNAVEESFTTFSDEKNKLLFCQEYNIGPGYLLSVSFFDSRKNTLNLIKAFLEVKDKIKNKLVLIGQNRYSNPKEYIQIAKLITQNRDSILHIPYLERNSDILKSAYYNCKIHIMPSLIETPGISNLEALLFGKPIIVGYCEPVFEYFGNKSEYVNPKSIKDISNAIAKVSRKKEKDAISFDNMNTQFIQDNYLLEQVIKKLKEIYRDL